MSRRCCCVVRCKNTTINSQCKFYSFPTTAWKLDQRNKWIAVVKRENVNGSSWSPKPNDTICSEHFIGGKKSDVQASPSYVPTIFPGRYRKKKNNDEQALARHTRLLKRRSTKVSDDEGNGLNQTQPLGVDQECQVNLSSESNLRESTFICNRFIYSDDCDAEIQVDLAAAEKTSSERQSTASKNNQLVDISSIKNHQQLPDLSGVSFSNFIFLLTRLPVKKRLPPIEDGLSLFLMKLTCGLTFGELSSLFIGVHVTKISGIYYSILEDLAAATTNLVFWPEKVTVPECCTADYINTKVIIECSQFKIEIPTAENDHVVKYTHYKKGFTSKVIIGVTPGENTTLKSKIAVGRTMDSQTTGKLVNPSEARDIDLAGKGVPEIKNIIDKSGKQIKMVVPLLSVPKPKIKEEPPET